LAYIDTEGRITVGVGRNLSDKGLSTVEIEFLLANDVKEVTAELESKLPYFQALDPVRQAVLVNMCFNLGFAGLGKFADMLAAVAQGDWRKAAAEMLRSKWADQVGKEPGQRADRLAYQMREGIWV
jgi:lysozyme